MLILYLFHTASRYFLPLIARSFNLFSTDTLVRSIHSLDYNFGRSNYCCTTDLLLLPTIILARRDDPYLLAIGNNFRLVLTLYFRLILANFVTMRPFSLLCFL